MDGLYAEARAKKRVTTKDKLLKTLLYIAMIGSLGIGFFGGSMILVVVGLIFLAVGYYFLPRLSVEYEYVFCDGQVDFDRISGGAKRKTLLRVDFDKLVVIAPKNSHALDGYRHNGVEVKALSDGYYRVTITIADVTDSNGTPADLKTLYVRGSGTTASGYIDNLQAN